MRQSPHHTTNGIGTSGLGGFGGMDSAYDYRVPKSPANATPNSLNVSGLSNGSSASSHGYDSKHDNKHDNHGNSSVDGEEALLDLAQLEELHQEAERMKALGNKHMAAQVSFLSSRLVTLNILEVIFCGITQQNLSVLPPPNKQ